MTKETAVSSTFFPSLLAAAISENWSLIDEVFVPRLSELNGNIMARSLLKNARNKDPNIRDLVATCLPHLKITSKRVYRDTIRAMIIMVSLDQEVFPAGRAVLYLLHQTENDDETGIKIKEALEVFKKRVKENNWEEQLREAIPELVTLFT